MKYYLYFALKISELLKKFSIAQEKFLKIYNNVINFDREYRNI
jgi:hypothetical protein